MKSVLFILYISLLSSTIMAESPVRENGLIGSSKMIEVSSKDLSYGYGVFDCIYLKPVVDLLQKEKGFDLEKFGYTFGLFAEYKVSKMLNLFADYDLIRNKEFENMVFGLRYVF